jgi:hypothetical protein
MSAAEKDQSAFALSTLAERAQSLTLADQMTECVSLLQAPGILMDSLLRYVDEIRAEAPLRGRLSLLSSEGEEKGGFFYPSRELFVQGEFGSFTCLATSVDFALPDEEKPVRPSLAGIDFAAVTCESRPFPLLGFTPATDQQSAYPALLRGLSSLIELTRPRRFDLLDRDVYRGLLGPAPVFDLALILWDDEVESDPRRPLCELTRDLAEVLKGALESERRFPPVLNDIVCLRMNPKRFDARLRFVWRV